jgi:hypothetical protein
MKARPFLAVFALIGIAVVAGGFFAGRALKPEPTPGYAFDVSSPAYSAALPLPGLTKGGFSGFGETNGLPGSTLLSGKVESVTADGVVIEAADGTKTSVRLTNPISVTRIDAANRDALKNGATVVLRQAEGSDEVEAVLVVTPP